MEKLYKFREISLFRNEPFGISNVSFEIQAHRKYHIVLKNSDKMNTLLGVLEGRCREDSGIVDRARSLFIQSDRMLLGDKVYSKTAGKWLALNDEFFYFGGRRRSKRTFMDDLKARSIRHFPIYKLRGEDKIKFALLAITFQESGLIIISRLLATNLNEVMRNHLERIIRDTNCGLCLVTNEEDPNYLEQVIRESGEINYIDLTNA